MSLWQATLKPIACQPKFGDVRHMKVIAADKDAAVRLVREHAEVEQCGYAICDIQEVESHGSK